MISLAFFGFFLFGYSFALTSSKDITGNLDIPSFYKDSIQNVAYSLCPQTAVKNMSWIVQYFLRPGQTDFFCADFLVKNSSSVSVKYTFVDGKMSKYGTILCDAALMTWHDLFFPYYKKNILILSGNSSVRIKDRIYVPKTVSGTQNFCLTYRMEKKPKEERYALSGMFTVVVRKSIPFRIVAVWKNYPYERLDDVRFFYQDYSLRIAWWLVVLFWLFLFQSLIASSHSKK